MNTCNYFCSIRRLNGHIIHYTFQTHFDKPTWVVDICMEMLWWIPRQTHVQFVKVYLKSMRYYMNIQTSYDTKRISGVHGICPGLRKYFKTMLYLGFSWATASLNRNPPFKIFVVPPLMSLNFRPWILCIFNTHQRTNIWHK